MQTFDYAGEDFADDGYYQEQGYDEQNIDAASPQDDFYGYASWWFDYAIVLFMFCIMFYRQSHRTDS